MTITDCLYGYHISFGRDGNGERLEAWFGLYFKAWAEHGKSPVWLQFWGETAGRVADRLTAFGQVVRDDTEVEWLGSTRPRPDATESEAVQDLVDHLAKVKATLSGAALLVQQPPTS